MKIRVTKPESCSSLAINSPANPTKLTISPTVAFPSAASIAPIANTATIVTVDADRVSTVSETPPGEHRILGGEQRHHQRAQR